MMSDDYISLRNGRRLTIHSHVSECGSSAASDFAPSSPRKKDNTAFSPPQSPEVIPAKPNYLSPKPVQRAVTDPTLANPRVHFTNGEAEKAINAARVQHKTLLDLRKREKYELTIRTKHREERQDPKVLRWLGEIKGRQEELKIQQGLLFTPTVPSKFVEPPALGRPRLAGAALLEQRQQERDELVSRTTARSAAHRPLILLDNKKRQEMEVVIRRQALEREKMIDAQRNRETAATTADGARRVSMALLEAAGIDEPGRCQAAVTKKDNERKLYEEVDWISNELERIGKLIHQDHTEGEG